MTAPYAASLGLTEINTFLSPLSRTFGLAPVSSVGVHVGLPAHSSTWVSFYSVRDKAFAQSLGHIPTPYEICSNAKNTKVNYR